MVSVIFQPGRKGSLSPIPAEVWGALCRNGTELRFAAGQIIHQTGDADRSLSLVLAGRIRFRRLTPNGTEVNLGIIGRARTFGEISLLTGRSRTHDAVAETPVRLSRLSLERMQELFDENPSIRDWMMVELANLLNRALDALDNSVRLSAAQKVARTLAENGSGRVAIRQSELAQSLNLSRKSVSRALGFLRARGLLAQGYGAIEVIDTAGLAAYAANVH